MTKLTKEVCIKARSPPASLPFKGQVTEQATVKWSIGLLQDPVTWYGIYYTGTQMTQWDFKNKGTSRWTGKGSFVLGVPLRHLRPSVIYSVPCDRIQQRAYCNKSALELPCVGGPVRVGLYRDFAPHSSAP